MKNDSCQLLEDSFVSALWHLPTVLTSLSLAKSPMPDELFKCFCKLTALKHISLECCDLSQCDMIHFSKFKGLQSLAVVGSCLPAESITALLQVLPACITTLDLSDNDLSGSCVSTCALGALTNLRKLRLSVAPSGCVFSEEAGYNLARQLVLLRELRKLGLYVTWERGCDANTVERALYD